VLILIFAAVLGGILGLVLSVPVGIVAGLGSNPVARAVVQQVVQQLGNILAVPFGSIAFTLLYYDSRIRKEAFDLEMMARDLGAAAPRVAPPPRSAAAPVEAGPSGRTLPAPFKTCPNCGVQVPPVRPTCPNCGTPVPFRSPG
jgi:hypothetical protein